MKLGLGRGGWGVEHRIFFEGQNSMDFRSGNLVGNLSYLTGKGGGVVFQFLRWVLFKSEG